MAFGQTDGMRLGVVIVVVVVLVVGGVWWWSQSTQTTSASGVVRVTSVPSGASVTLAGKDVGSTPYFSDNSWSGTVTVALSLPGYRKWTGSFEGGRDVKLEVSLVRKRVRKVMQVDAGVIEVELDEEEEAPRHTKGPLRPPEPTEFVDDDLEAEAKKSP